MRAALACLLCTAACAIPADWRPNYGLPYSEPTTWPYCVTELANHWISYPAQKKRRLDLVCGPKALTLATGLALLGAYSFDQISDQKGGRVRIVFSAQTATLDDETRFMNERLADVLRQPARTATYAPWQQSREVAVEPLWDELFVRGRPWRHMVVADAEDPANVWVEDYVTRLDESVLLVLRARYALDVPHVPQKLEKRRALTRSILEGIDVVALR